MFGIGRLGHHCTTNSTTGNCRRTWSGGCGFFIFRYLRSPDTTSDDISTAMGYLAGNGTGNPFQRVTLISRWPHNMAPLLEELGCLSERIRGHCAIERQVEKLQRITWTRRGAGVGERTSSCPNSAHAVPGWGYSWGSSWLQLLFIRCCERDCLGSPRSYRPVFAVRLLGTSHLTSRRPGYANVSWIRSRQLHLSLTAKARFVAKLHLPSWPSGINHVIIMLIRNALRTRETIGFAGCQHTQYGLGSAAPHLPAGASLPETADRTRVHKQIIGPLLTLSTLSFFPSDTQFPSWPWCTILRQIGKQLSTLGRMVIAERLCITNTSCAITNQPVINTWNLFDPSAVLPIRPQPIADLSWPQETESRLVNHGALLLTPQPRKLG